MRTKRLSSCVFALLKLCRVLLLNLSRYVNVNTSCAARSFRFSPFQRSCAGWYASSAAQASLIATAPLLTSASIRCVAAFLMRSRILCAFCDEFNCCTFRNYFILPFAQGNLKHLASLAVRTLSSQLVIGVCVRSVTENRFPSHNPIARFLSSSQLEKKPYPSSSEGYSAIKTGHVCD